jgi:sugar/nucleoside kinase (ribokinase family)
VLSAGILVADCVARPVLRQPQPGRLELVDHIGLHSGGSAGNTGYGLAKLGQRVALVARVGQDGFGDYLVAECARHGCDPSLIKRDDTVGTSATIVTVDGEGERTFLHYVGANGHLTHEDVPLEAARARGARLVHLAGFYALDALQADDGAGLKGLFQRATQLGLVTSLDCVWDATGAWHRIRQALPLTDVFCPSLHEARAITDRDDPNEVADELMRLGVRRHIALKMGPEGSLVASRDGQRHRLPAASVTAVDGTGAGDAFIAGFLAGLLNGLPVRESALLGNAAGALCVTQVGATAGLRGWEDTRALATSITGAA